MCHAETNIYDNSERRSVKRNDTTEDNGGDFTAAAEPFALFNVWFDEAQLSEPNDPNAMALATCDANGLPNVRMVLLKGLDEAATDARGFVFFTNLESAKGGELKANPQAALLFHWKSLRRQVRIRGPITSVSVAEADAYFATRPRMSRIGAWASDQSRPLSSRENFETSIAEHSERYGEGDIPRPQHWSGFRLTPLHIEFWHDRPFRLHDRLLFIRAHAGDPWQTARLYP